MKYVRIVSLIVFFIPRVVHSQHEKKNLVIVIADDLGLKDLGCYGNKYISTINIDRIAQNSLVFDESYAAAPVCSPTRASILTGQHPARLGLTNFIDGKRTDPLSPVYPASYINYLPSGLPTLPWAFQKAGYQTALIGKWHLGENTRPNESNPKKHGFQLAMHYEYGLIPDKTSYTWIKGIDSSGNRYQLPDITKKITNDAINYLDTVSSSFLLFVTHYNPHLPLQPKSDLLGKYMVKKNPYGTQINPLYAAMVEELDIEVGKLWKKLESRNLLSNTIFIFISDNGGVVVEEAGVSQPTTMAPYKEGKGTLYEGGIRIPQIIYHPYVSIGKRINWPTSTVDLFSTLSEWCGIKFPVSTTDGQSFSHVVYNEKKRLDKNPIYWYYPHFSNQGGRPTAAIRVGNYKFIRSLEFNKIELYNLLKDPGEKNNLALRKPKLSRNLNSKLTSWLKSVNANSIIKK